MKLLIRQALIASANAPHHNTIQDILITGDTIAQIAPHIDTDADKTLEAEGLIVSQGWVDPFAHFCDPGFEHRETLESGAAAAAAGGYTRMMLLPNTKPVADNKAAITYLLNKSQSLPVHIHPLGALTRATEGKELAEMYDMHQNGATAFSDGLYPVQQPGILLKALQYVKAFEGVVVQMPVDKSIGVHGLMNEGIISTQMGLPGIPALAEEIMVKRDLDLLRYTQSKLHFTGISTAKSLQLIQEARKEGWNVTCSVTPYHLLFCDEDLQQYNTLLKVNPPLRSAADRAALQQGIVDGSIDCIATHHLPQHSDQKVCEFEYAAWGMIGLQTSFAIINQLFPDLAAGRLAQLFSDNARNIFTLPATNIKEGEKAELSFFSKKGATILTSTNNLSKSQNSPLLNHSLTGKVWGTFVKGNFNTY
ncbi:MAG: dihydroorotase [Sediminibacterium sp.]|nr:dihydroorotase [Sediminibacterium sp.]